MRAAADARFDARLLVVVGLALFAASCFLNSDINQDYAGPQFLVPNVVRAVGQALVMTPLSVLATGGIEREQASSASALFNMMRNLGGSIGIALLQTLLTRREQFHSAVINPSVLIAQRGDTAASRRCSATSWRPAPRDPATAWHDAVVAVAARPGAVVFPGLWRHVLSSWECAAAGDCRGGHDAADDGRRRRRALSAHASSRLAIVTISAKSCATATAPSAIDGGP